MEHAKAHKLWRPLVFVAYVPQKSWAISPLLSGQKATTKRSQHNQFVCGEEHMRTMYKTSVLQHKHSIKSLPPCGPGGERLVSGVIIRSGLDFKCKLKLSEATLSPNIIAKTSGEQIPQRQGIKHMGVCVMKEGCESFTTHNTQNTQMVGHLSLWSLVPQKSWPSSPLFCGHKGGNRETSTFTFCVWRTYEK